MLPAPLTSVFLGLQLQACWASELSPIGLLSSFKIHSFLKKIYFFGCSGSSWLCTGFLWLQRLGLLVVAVHGLLNAVASPVAEHGLRHVSTAAAARRLESADSVVVAHGLPLCSLWNRPGMLHAKSHQSCPALRNPMHCSPPGSSIHGILKQEYWSG